MKKGYKAVAIEYKQAVEKARRQACEWLKDTMGIEKSGYVETNDGRVFRVTRINFEAIGLPLYLYGNKVRKDGSLGSHEHPIGAPDMVRSRK